MTEDEFRAMCEHHDLTYSYSDDFGVWQRGNASYSAIVAAAANLPRPTAVRIWNEVVDTKLVPAARAMFYWQDRSAA